MVRDIICTCMHHVYAGTEYVKRACALYMYYGTPGDHKWCILHCFSYSEPTNVQYTLLKSDVTSPDHVVRCRGLLFF